MRHTRPEGGKALIPAIVLIMMAPFYSLIQVFPWVMASRLVPALLGAPPYPLRPPGFTGPDPYDPYGPDSPEPRPFKNPGLMMCRELLDMCGDQG